MRTMRTYMAKKEEVQRRWLLVDAKDKVLGRLATRIAMILQGKDKPTYTPHVDTGDFVVVINAERVRLTGRKEKQKVYKRYSGYPGGLKETPAAKVRAQHPERMIEQAVKRMLPKSKLGSAMLSKLKVYAGADHPHGAQDPEPVEL